MEAAEDLTRTLAEYLSDLSWSRFAARDIEQMQVLVLDHLGVTLAGSALACGRTMTDWARKLASKGRAPVAGAEFRAAPSVAGFVNATAAHGFEFDDTHDKSLTHAGAVVVASALAVGCERGLGGPAFLEAVAVGYEAMTRVAMASGAATALKRGYHPTALFGGFGAVAAAGKLLGFAPADYCRAWGLVLSWSGGSMQFAHEAEGATVKRLHGGFGAMSGIICAELAAGGIAGPLRALDGNFGACRLFGDGPNREHLEIADGAPLEIHRVNLKPYNCSRPFHSTIDALRQVVDGFPLASAAVRRITVRAPKIVVEHHMLTRPRSTMAAQYSLPFVMGAVLRNGPNELGAYEPDRLEDAEVLALADRVQALEDPEFEALYPERFGSAVEIEFTDGSRRSAKVLDSYGTAAKPMPLVAVAEKIRALGRYAGVRTDYEALVETVNGLPTLESLEPLAALLLAPDGPRAQAADARTGRQ